MKGSLLAIAAYLLLVAQLGLAPLGASTHYGTVEPMFMLLIVVWIGLWAPANLVAPASAAAGLLMDLATPWPVQLASGIEAPTIVGPYVLGYIAAGYLLLQMRPMLFRDHPLTIGTMVLIGGAAASLVVVGLMTVRSWYEPVIGWSAGNELMRRLLGLGVTVVIAVALAVPLRGWLRKLSVPVSGGPHWKGRR